MRHFSIRRVKALFLTIFSFGCCFVLLLNLMIHQLNNSDHDLAPSSSHMSPSSYGMKLRQLSQQRDNLMLDRNPQKDDRPQGVKDSERHKEVQDSDGPQGGPPSKVETDLHSERDPKVKDSGVNKKVENFLFPRGRNGREDEYSYEEDIEKVVIQEEDEGEEDEEEFEEDDIDPDEDYDEDAADSNGGDLFENLKNSSKVFTKPALNFQEVTPKPGVNSSIHAPQGQVPVPQGKESGGFNGPIVVDGVYWSPKVEQLIPKGLSNWTVLEWTRLMRGVPVKSLQLPSWDRCGRPKNAFVIMKDGTAMCARYRHPHDNLVLGEVLSFYLSVLLGMDNVPGVLLSRVSNNSLHWQGHDTVRVGWASNNYVALIQWIDDMTAQRAHVKMPEVVLEAYRTGDVVSQDTLAERKMTGGELSEVLQWGTMVIFDYLTGNYDRVASMQDAAEREKQPKIIQESIRNLRKSTTSGKLWLIDNESGLLDAYDLLYHSGKNGDRFLRFHSDMLKTLCIFQRHLVKALYRLHNSISPHEVLQHFARIHEPLISQIEKVAAYDLFKANFSKRLADVIQWIEFCSESHKR